MEELTAVITAGATLAGVIITLFIQERIRKIALREKRESAYAQLLADILEIRRGAQIDQADQSRIMKNVSEILLIGDEEIVDVAQKIFMKALHGYDPIIKLDANAEDLAEIVTAIRERNQKKSWWHFWR